MKSKKERMKSLNELTTLITPSRECGARFNFIIGIHVKGCIISNMYILLDSGWIGNIEVR